MTLKGASAQAEVLCISFVVGDGKFRLGRPGPKSKAATRPFLGLLSCADTELYNTVEIQQGSDSPKRSV